jgi:hypothetical protein
MPIERKELIPQPFKGEVQVKVVLPDEAIQLLKDLHADRQAIGFGAVVLIGLLAALAVKRLFQKE